MIKEMKKLLSAIGIIGFVFFPNLALAQEEVTAEASIPAPVIESTPSDLPPASTLEASPVQESATSQETIPSASLETTENPQEQNPGLEDAIELIDQATADMEAASSTVEVVDIIEEATTTPVALLPVAILEPQKEYSFELIGAAIASQGEGEEVTDVPDLSIAPHALTVSGECSDPFFVILIYKSQEDYNANPSSYIFNKAFPCENGRYSYDVRELPFSLETGGFFLLVAGQGDRGPWKPITALIPIGITVKTIMPESSTTPDAAQ